ncbi:MAG: hypothetical protein Edafosvirus7_34 [Edafosvirus sp.]|uniref:Uncharacterized protein n=1 Tax=Edafosvirus sp. TaxID=2487765 RepID=A0A3G4ZTL6_9VIRU|nr:MAG: hypothetical protein Edafosvirus7_34 [Edafosvirus sp.]
MNNKTNKNNSMKTIKMEPPIYNDTETISEYVSRVEEYMLQFKKQKYKIILDFVNKWLKPLDKTLVSLTDFKNMPEEKLLKDKKYNRKILRENVEDLKKSLNVKSFIDDETDSDDIADQCIIKFTGKLLNVIDYSIISFKKEKITYYSIKNKKQILL